MRKYHTCSLLMLLMVLPTIAVAQNGSRLIGTAFRGTINGEPMVLSDSTRYEYSGQRGGDLTTPDLKFDRSFDWGVDFMGELELQSGRARSYDGQENMLTDTSIVMNVPDPYVTSYMRWTYDAEGRPTSRVWFSNGDSINYATFAYTSTGKPAVNFNSSLTNGTWYNITETYTYNAMDSLTDKVVDSDWLSYSFHWDYTPEGWLAHHEELTPSGDLFLDYWYHPNGKLLATRAFGGQFGPQNDSVAYAWNDQFDTVMISSYNLILGADLPVSQRREAYDNDGLLIESINYQGVAPDFVPQSRMTTQRDAGGNPIVDSLFAWNGMAFVHVQCEFRSYDDLGNRTERIVANRVGPDLVPVFREYATYNGFGQITSSGSQDTLAGDFITTAEARWYYEEFATSVEESSVASVLNAFPNPCTDAVWIPLAGEQVVRGVDVVDAAGRQHRVIAQVRDQGIELSTATLPTGAYVVRLRTEGGVFRSRVIVE